MSDYRMRLLDRVDSSGSLARAAEELGLSYRRAWGKLKELEANLGFPLVKSEAGGPGGGHTTLTTQAQAFVHAYQEFSERVEADVSATFDEVLRPAMSRGNRPHDHR